MADPLNVALGQESPAAPVTADVINAANQSRLRQQKQQQQNQYYDPWKNAPMMAQLLNAGGTQQSPVMAQARAMFQNLLSGGPNG